MRVLDWLEKNKLFYRNLRTSDIMQDVRDQAAVHMERLETNRILKRQRPNEDPSVLDYRIENERRITSGDVDRWLVKMSRIIRDNIFSNIEGSDLLREYQDEKRYVVMGEGYTYFQWVIDFILPESLKDPNLIKVNLPFVKEMPLMRPREVPQTMRIPFEEIVIPFDSVIFRNHVLAFQYGMKNMGKNKKKQPIYFLADEKDWYIYEPFTDADKGIVYEVDFWYQHDSGQLPFVNGIGVFKERLEHGVREQYKESLLHSAFEYWDEFIGFFSDNQAIGVNHAHPKMVQIEMPCPHCMHKNTARGFIEVKMHDGELSRETCKHCQGSKIIRTPGPYSTMTIPNDMMAGDIKLKPSDAIHPVVYGESQFQMRMNIAWDLLDKGRKAVGLDLLTDMSESGVAKEFRLEDLQDIIGNVVKHIHQFIVNDLWLKECLLQPNENRRERPKFDIPKTYYVEDENTVLKGIKELPLTDRQNKIIDYYSKKYKGDMVMAKIYEMSVLFAPIQLLDKEEIQDYVSSAIFKKTDVIKGMYATWAMKQIGEDLLTMTVDQVFERANELIRPFLPTKPIDMNGIA